MIPAQKEKFTILYGIAISSPVYRTSRTTFTDAGNGRHNHDNFLSDPGRRWCLRYPIQWKEMVLMAAIILLLLFPFALLSELLKITK